MKILGIDPGLARTGVAVLSVEKEGTDFSWKILEHKATEKRLWEYFKSLSELINCEKPNQIVIENVFRGPNIKTLIRIAELRGVYLLLSQIQGLPVQEFSPREIKQSVTGSGASSKEQVRYMVKKILGIEEELPLDVSDAFGAIICYMNRNQEYAGIH